MNRLQTYLFRLGGLLLTTGAVLPVFHLKAAALAFGLGALLFVPFQLADRYSGTNLVVRRLYRQRQFSDLMLLVAAALLAMQAWHVGRFVRGEWIIALTVAVVAQLYCVFRIEQEIKKEHKNKTHD